MTDFSGSFGPAVQPGAERSNAPCGTWACGAASLTTPSGWRTAMTSSEIERGSLEPGGQLVLTLKAAEQGATRGDVADLTDHLRRIERLLKAARQGPG